MNRIAWIVLLLVLLALPSVALADEHEPLPGPAPAPAPSGYPAPLPSPAPEPTPVPERGNSWWPTTDEWVYAPIDSAHYEAQHQGALLGWQANADIPLSGAQVAASLRTTLLDVVPAVVDALGDSLRQLLVGIFIVAVLALGVTYVLWPAVFYRLVDPRVVVVLVVVLPVFLPHAGQLFRAMEETRATLATSLYSDTFLYVRDLPALQPGAHAVGQHPSPEAGHELAPIAPFTPDGQDRPSLDLAAAYVHATAADLTGPRTLLPKAFTDRYFSVSAAEFRALPPEQRQALLDMAAAGRMVQWSGLALTTLAFLDQVFHLVWTIGLMTMIVVLVIASGFAMFLPMRLLVQAMGYECLKISVVSWAISALQGLFLAVVYVYAVTGQSGNVVGAAILVSLITLGLLVLAIKLVYRAFFHTTHLFAGDPMRVPSFQRLIARQSQPLAGQAAPVPAQLQQARDRLLAYKAARQLGASRRYAASYAVSGSQRVQHAGAVAMALGKLDPETEQGLIAGAVGARGKPASLRGQVALRHRLRRAPHSQPSVNGHSSQNGAGSNGKVMLKVRKHGTRGLRPRAQKKVHP